MSAYSAHDREMLGAFLRTQEERWTTRTERERVGGWARGRNLSERATGNNMSGDERQGLFVPVIGNSISSQRESAAEIHYQNLVQGVFISTACSASSPVHRLSFAQACTRCRFCSQARDVLQSARQGGQWSLALAQTSIQKSRRQPQDLPTPSL